MAGELIELGGFFILVILGAALLGLIMLVISIIAGRKSQKYRKLIMDLYVAGKTKLLAKEDNIDLELEHESFKNWLKKERIKDSELDLDRAIEEELKEKLVEDKTTKKK